MMVTVRNCNSSGDEGDFTASFTVRVAVPTVTKVEIYPKDISIGWGKSWYFRAEVTGDDFPSQAVTWEIIPAFANTDNDKNISIDDAGKVTVGSKVTVDTTATVRATSVADPDKVSDPATITVIRPTSGTGAAGAITLKAKTGTAAEKTVLNGGTLTLEPSSTVTTTVTAAVSGAQPGYDQLTWTFTKPASMTTGSVTTGAVTTQDTGLAITPGNAFTQMMVTVRNCKSDGDLGDLSATFTVIVSPPPPSTDGSGAVAIQFWTDKADSALLTDTPGATLSRTGSNGVPTQAVIQGTTDYSAYQWSLNGIDIEESKGGKEAFYTFKSALRGDGTYTVGLRVQENTDANAPWYSTTITITVLN
jgi:hypothetical protein